MKDEKAKRIKQEKEQILESLEKQRMHFLFIIENLTYNYNNLFSKKYKITLNIVDKCLDGEDLSKDEKTDTIEIDKEIAIPIILDYIKEITEIKKDLESGKLSYKGI